MDDLEVPRFSTPAATRDLVWRGELLGAPFAESPLERARARIRDFGRSELEAQCRAIGESVDAAGSGSPGALRLQLGTPAALEPDEAWLPDTRYTPASGSLV
jgi:hypothetical protein